VLTYKTLNTSVPRYLSQRINRRVNTRTLRSTATPLLIQPFARTDFAKRSVFRCAAPSVWNSLPASVIGSDSLSVFKSRLKHSYFVGANTQPTADSASEITTLWRFSNMFIIIVVIIIINCSLTAKKSSLCAIGTHVNQHDLWSRFAVRTADVQDQLPTRDLSPLDWLHSEGCPTPIVLCNAFRRSPNEQNKLRRTMCNHWSGTKDNSLPRDTLFAHHSNTVIVLSAN